ncbi:hypothetical protein SDC9_132991 [bioreactor metagenome]|uniref:Uncharacterized protein n=1 Tax=bioreactor metagenome TaxID=1076179 RepID=A0A645DA25_9ZZZZ
MGRAHTWGIEFHTASSDTDLPLKNFLHEVGHVIDYANSCRFSKPFDKDRGGSTPVWVKDGYVNEKLLLANLTEPVQSKYISNEDNDPYEFWADAFANYVGDNINTGELTGAGKQMYDDVHRILNQ